MLQKNIKSKHMLTYPTAISYQRKWDKEKIVQQQLLSYQKTNK